MEDPADRLRISRKELKRDAKRNFKHHYLMYVVACLFALVMQSEFLASDNMIGARRQVVTDATQAIFELTGEDQVRQFEETYLTIDDEASSWYSVVEDALNNKTFENEKVNEVFGRTKGILNQLINY